MIEGGVAGGSAAHHADQRRTVASRLVAEAKWLDAVAEDERTTAAHLERLSPAYAILHDLKLSGSQGNIDHVVVGPGGAFLVVTRRFAEAVVLRDGALYAGERALHGELEGLRSVAGQLSQALGTPVAPVLGFHGTTLPATTPPSIDGVLVCGAEYLVRVITRASHTLLPPHQITEVTEKALPMLFNPGSVARSEVPTRPEPPTQAMDPGGPSLPVLPATGLAGTVRTPVAPPVVAPVVAPPVLVSPQMDELARRSDDAFRPVDPASEPAPAPYAAAAAAFSPVALGGGAAAPSAADPAKPVKAPRHKRSRGFVLAVVLSLCLVAGTLGAAASMILKDDKADEGGGVSPTVPLDTTTTVAGPLAAALPAPLVSFSPVCPSAGSGWQLLADWPGDIPGLVQYDVELQGGDGAWTMLTPLVSSAVTIASLEAQPPNSTLTLRITAVMSDGSRSINQPTAITTPTSAC